MAFSLALVIFSVSAFWQSYGISGFTGLSQPGVFPMLASATMIISSLVIMGSVYSKPEDSASQDQRTGISRFCREIIPLRLAGIVGLIGAYVVTMPLLGFVLSSAAFLFVAFWFLWRRGPWTSAALTVGSLTVIHFIFRSVFQVVLPQGSILQGMF